MEIDADQLLLNAIKDAVREGVKAKFTQTYGSPFDEVIKGAVLAHADAIRGLISDAIGSCLKDEAFRAGIAEQVRHIVAKQLVQKFGGELEKQVNQLKSDPATRARITLAIEDIVRQKA